MSFHSVGDLAQSFQLRFHNARLKADIQTLARELASGRKDDLPRALRGDFSALTGLERGLSRLESFRVTASEAGFFAETQQRVLEQIQTDLQGLSGRLLLNANMANPDYVTSVGAEARAQFDAIVSRLNGSVAGRSLFAGAATDRPALADSATILADLTAAVAADATAADVIATVETWLAPGGGYDTVAYTGSLTALAPWPIGPDAFVTLDFDAADVSVRGALKGVLLGALIDEGALAGDEAERRNLAIAAGEALLSGQVALLTDRARLGTAEETISRALAEIATESSALEVTRSALVAADPFETASRLQEAETQLSTLYAVTARTARLSLTEYLR